MFVNFIHSSCFPRNTVFFLIFTLFLGDINTIENYCISFSGKIFFEFKKYTLFDFY